MFEVFMFNVHRKSKESPLQSSPENISSKKVFHPKLLSFGCVRLTTESFLLHFMDLLLELVNASRGKCTLETLKYIQDKPLFFYSNV